MRTVLLAIPFCLCLSFGAVACEGQTGTPIFRDNFADDSGGWESNRSWQIKPPEFIATLEKRVTVTEVVNQTFNAADGDYCVDVVLPSDQPGAVNPGAALTFFGTERSVFGLSVLADGGTRIGRWTDGKYSSLAATDGSTGGVKSGPGAINTLRVIAKAGTLTAMVNGKVLKTIRVQMPNVPLKFGLRALVAPDEIPGSVHVSFRNFSVTTVK